MRIRSLETYKITLPFRFAFAHSLASRSESQNLIVKITLDNGTSGYGEGVPRDYVTGENITCAEDHVLLSYAPEIIGLSFEDPGKLIADIKKAFSFLGLDQKAQGSSWCALELALLDALARAHSLPLWQLLGKRRLERIPYGGTVPFGKKNTLQAILYFYKFYGFKTVKLKVGAANLEDDLDKLKLARKILGRDCILRVDANCAWNLVQAQKAVEAFRPYKISSYEQPLPAENWSDLKKLAESIEEDLVLDESLCTLKQARELAENKVCDAFNIRVSKAGGLLASQEMIEIAQKHGLKVHLGAQVGESGILSAAARQLATVNEALENYEGSANFFLLKKDICSENLNCKAGGWGDLAYAKKRPGLGLNILDRRVNSMTESDNSDSDSDSDSKQEIQTKARADAALSPEVR